MIAEVKYGLEFPADNSQYYISIEWGEIKM